MHLNQSSITTNILIKFSDKTISHWLRVLIHRLIITTKVKTLMHITKWNLRVNTFSDKTISPSLKITSIHKIWDSQQLLYTKKYSEKANITFPQDFPSTQNENSEQLLYLKKYSDKANITFPHFPSIYTNETQSNYFISKSTMIKQISPSLIP